MTKRWRRRCPRRYGREDGRKVHAVCAQVRRQGDPPGHLSGDGGAGPQPEHHALPRRRADPVLARSTTARIPRRRAVWSWSSCCSRPRPVWATARRRSSRFISSRSRKASTTTRATRTTTCSSWPAACRAKRMFPNFSFLDAPFNLQYYKPGHPETEVGYMGCRTRVMANVYDPDPRDHLRPRQPVASRRSTCRASPSAATAIWTGSSRISTARSTSSSTSCSTASSIQCGKRVRNYPFLMGEGVWLDSEKLGPDDEVARGAQARHADARLHRPGRVPEGAASAYTTARATRRRTSALRSSATCASAWMRQPRSTI